MALKRKMFPGFIPTQKERQSPCSLTRKLSHDHTLPCSLTPPFLHTPFCSYSLIPSLCTPSLPPSLLTLPSFRLNSLSPPLSLSLPLSPSLSHSLPLSLSSGCGITSIGGKRTLSPCHAHQPNHGTMMTRRLLTRISFTKKGFPRPFNVTRSG